MSFSNIHLPSLTNDLHLEFGNQTVNAVEKSDLESLNNSAPFKDYRAGVQSEDLVSKKIIKSRFTGEIQAWDGSRDGIIWGIYGIVRANRYHWEEKISAAANNLMIPIGSYGDISSLPLLAQNSATHNLWQEFTGKYAADIALLGLDDWVEKMKEYNDKVRDLMESRLDEAAANITISLRDVRKKNDGLFRAFIKRAEALTEIEGVDKYADFINRMNATIAKYAKKRSVSADEEK